MSKERELLERWLDDTIFEPDELDSLMEETRELLAQPEEDNKTCSLSFLKGYARGFDVAREDYKRKVINAFGVDDE
jgi:hypothetical protein